MEQVALTAEQITNKKMECFLRKNLFFYDNSTSIIIYIRTARNIQYDLELLRLSIKVKIPK